MFDSDARTKFPVILSSYMSKEKLNQSDIAEKLHVSMQTVSDWVNGKKFPRVDKMQELANLFGVLMSDMYSGSVSNNLQIESDDEYQLLDAYRNAEPKYRELAFELLIEHPMKKNKN